MLCPRKTVKQVSKSEDLTQNAHGINVNTIGYVGLSQLRGEKDE